MSSTHGIDRQALQNITCVEYHTAGEPFRIVTSPAVSLPGASVSERRLSAVSDPDVNVIRRLLCHEPRGHADMYGCFQVPPDDDGARLGVLFWHKDGFSTACGHGTIALGVWATESGLVPTEPDGETEIPIDVPSGRVTARVQRVGGSIRSVSTNATSPSLPTGRSTGHRVDREQPRVSHNSSTRGDWLRVTSCCIVP